MINSMTAFAREGDDGLVVELRSVNHRYLDCHFKLPEALRGLEPSWRELLQQSLNRGKVECTLRWQTNEAELQALEPNLDRVQQLAGARATLEASLGELQTPDYLSVLQWPGVLKGNSVDEESIKQKATAVFRNTLATLSENRAREGDAMAQFIRARLDAVQAEVDKTRALMPELIAGQRVRLETRLADLDIEVDPGRIEQELVLLAQKTDVEEELDRLQAHVQEVARVLDKGGPCGRRLDFLMQELNREANTLSSKSISSTSTQNAVELKVLIEQMREQIQNLE